MYIDSAKSKEGWSVVPTIPLNIGNISLNINGQMKRYKLEPAQYKSIRP